MDGLQFADRFLPPSATSLWATMNWVKPQFGWAAARSKNWSGVSTEQKSLLSGGSALQVPACQPESTAGSWGSLGAMIAAVLAAAGAADKRRDGDQAAVIRQPAPVVFPLQGNIPFPTVPDFDDLSQYFLVI